MTTYVNEAEIMQLMEPSIRDYCKWKWTAVEMEDRLSEARYVFLIVLRERYLPEEQVWGVFRRTLDEYMYYINRAEAWYRYHCTSLHTRIRTRTGEEGSPLIDMIASSQPDPCEILLNTLEESA
ncbi:hypothetical protein [Paenibacillus sp.]